MIRLAIVILNWNGIEFLKVHLPGVVEYTDENGSEIWIADNGSSDGSVKYVKDNFPEVRVVELERNYGFAGGYNRALDIIEAENYILLNSDIEVTPGWTVPLLRMMDADSDIAACMPRIRDLKRRDFFEHAGASGGYIDFLGYPFCRGRIFDITEPDHGQYEDIREVFWATGACMAVRGSDWHSFGGFDDSFFAHMEEIDLCWRLKNSGKKVMVCPSSIVYHLGGGTLPAENPRKTYLNFRNSLSMLVKNLPASRLWLIVLRLAFDWMSVFKFLAVLSFSNAVAVLHAHLSFFRLLPLLLRKRNELYTDKPATGEGKRSDHPEIYRRSIVIDFFIRRRRTFSELRF